jgi:branched-chain amino acid transport system substrate-binding protein
MGSLGTAMLMGGFGQPLLSGTFAAEDPIKIGHLTPRTGFGGQMGAYAVLGAQLAVEEANARGGVLGRPVEVVYEDSVNPGTAVQKARKLIEKDKVHVLVGEIISASTLAISEVAQEAGILFISTGSHSDEVRGTRCHRYNFNIDASNTMYVSAIGQWLIRNQKVTEWYFLTGDFAAGHDAYKVSKKLLLSQGGVELGNDLIPTNTPDYSPYILKLKSIQPDLVFLNLGGVDQTTFLKQYKEFGLPFEVVGAIADVVQFWNLGLDALTGVWPFVWYHGIPVSTAKEFTERFMKKFGKPPEDHAWSDYIAMHMVLEGMEKTGSIKSKDLVKFLESGAEFDIYKGRPCKFREWDHQLMQPVYVVRPKEREQMKDAWDIFEILEEIPGKNDSLETIMIKKEESGCRLEPL